MRRTFLVLLVMLAVGCVKTDLQPFPRVTRIEVHQSTSNPTLSDPKVTAAVTDFINGERLGWTRPLLFGPGSPVEAANINLYDESGWLGRFSVRSSVLPGGHALFEVRNRNMRAYKRVTKSEANQFLDLIGVGGELSENMDNEVRQQIANQPPTSRAADFIEPRAKFQPGDRVRVKVTQAEGTVCLRTKFFREDLYFVTLPESYHVFETIADRTQRDAWKAESAARSREWARSHGMAESAFDVPEYQPRPWHEEGPFYESDLELISNGPNPYVGSQAWMQV